MKTRLIAILLLVLLAAGILSGCVGASARQFREAATPTDSPVMTKNEPAPRESAPVTQPQHLGKEEAIAIALEAAGLAENQVTRLKAEFDYDDGTAEYDVEFHHEGWEYEYEIHAETGKILRPDKDRGD